MAGGRFLVRCRPWIQSRGLRDSSRLAHPAGRPSFSEKDILYMDNHVLCINKPAGLLSQGDRTGDIDVLSLAREYVRVAANKPGEAFVATVHRLDRPVSGAMCIARTSKAAARLSASFRDRHGVEKIYHAVVHGKLSGRGTREDFLASPSGSGAGGVRGGRGPRTTVVWTRSALVNRAALVEDTAISAGLSSPFPPTISGPEEPISSTSSTNESTASTTGDRTAEGGGDPPPLPPPSSPATNSHSNFSEDKAELAVLEWEAIALSPSRSSLLRCPRTGDPRTLVRLRLVTGRKHQIRVQLAEMGHPVVGDVRYGRRSRGVRSGGGSGPRGRWDDALEDSSIMLHASELAVPHPTRPDEVVRVVAPPPEAWGELCGREFVREGFAGSRG